jgi:3,4-dihydroxy 2-butanone 4-phosphate synthase / GTP cyclohydrolase II
MTDANRISEGIERIRRGDLIIMMDSEKRENEGDLIMAGSKADQAKINFILKEARGLLCVPMSAARTDELGLGLQVSDNEENFGTAFTVSVDAREGVTTGVSAADRALTIQLLANESKGRENFVTPGHILPLRAREGGVLVRAGHTEGYVRELRNFPGLLTHLPEVGW